VLGLTGIGYERYFRRSFLDLRTAGPATVRARGPAQWQFDLLLHNKTAILVGIAAGVAASLISVILLSIATALPQELLLSLLPKSITTAIGVEMSSRIGGIPSITSASIVFTGIEGAVLARPLARLFRIITEPVGARIGDRGPLPTRSEPRARIEISELTGAISSLAIVLSGLFDVLLIPLHATLCFPEKNRDAKKRPFTVLPISLPIISSG
jgi:putative effector of murein hydrolase